MPNHPSVIARPTDEGFAGRYVHNNGQPDVRLPLLRQLYAGPFRSDLDAMLTFLLDDHPAGWSQLGTDPTADTGWINPMPPIGDNGFRCYCHGDRGDAAGLNTQDNTTPELADWIYVLHPDGIEVIEWDETRGAWRSDPTRPPWDLPLHATAAALGHGTLADTEQYAT